MKEVEIFKEKMFEDIKHIDEFCNEYWSARELQEVLKYKKWSNFELVIKKAQNTCKNSNYKVKDHFVQVNKMKKLAKGTTRKIKDYKLSRYACYIIVQNANPKIKAVALAQAYIAIQTRKMELREKNNHNTGYEGLYNGETKMEGIELVDNLFRISLTEQVINNKNIKTEKEINDTYCKVGKALRDAIKELGGNMPEDFSKPRKKL